MTMPVEEMEVCLLPCLPPATYQVTIMEMVTPSTFWVTESPQAVLTEDRIKLNAFEEELRAIVQRKHSVQTKCIPQKGKLVAVQSLDTALWHRGLIKNVKNFSSKNLYDVFLVDYGKTLRDVPQILIGELPSYMSNLDSQAFEVQLYGVLPTTVDVDFDNNQMKRVIADEWTVGSHSLMERVLKDSRSGHLEAISRDGRKVYGNLYVDMQGSFLNLAEVLLKRKCAVISEEQFKKELKMRKLQKQKEDQNPKVYKIPVLPGEPSDGISFSDQCNVVPPMELQANKFKTSNANDCSSLNPLSHHHIPEPMKQVSRGRGAHLTEQRNVLELIPGERAKVDPEKPTETMGNHPRSQSIKTEKRTSPSQLKLIPAGSNTSTKHIKRTVETGFQNMKHRFESYTKGRSGSSGGSFSSSSDESNSTSSIKSDTRQNFRSELEEADFKQKRGTRSGETVPRLRTADIPDLLRNAERVERKLPGVKPQHEFGQNGHIHGNLNRKSLEETTLKTSEMDKDLNSQPVDSVAGSTNLHSTRSTRSKLIDILAQLQSAGNPTSKDCTSDTDSHYCNSINRSKTSIGVTEAPVENTSINSEENRTQPCIESPAGVDPSIVKLGQDSRQKCSKKRTSLKDYLSLYNGQMLGGEPVNEDVNQDIAFHTSFVSDHTIKDSKNGSSSAAQQVLSSNESTSQEYEVNQAGLNDGCYVDGTNKPSEHTLNHTAKQASLEGEPLESGQKVVTTYSYGSDSNSPPNKATKSLLSLITEQVPLEIESTPEQETSEHCATSNTCENNARKPAKNLLSLIFQQVPLKEKVVESEQEVRKKETSSVSHTRRSKNLLSLISQQISTEEETPLPPSQLVESSKTSLDLGYQQVSTKGDSQDILSSGGSVIHSVSKTGAQFGPVEGVPGGGGNQSAAEEHVTSHIEADDCLSSTHSSLSQHSDVSRDKNQNKPRRSLLDIIAEMDSKRTPQPAGEPATKGDAREDSIVTQPSTPQSRLPNIAIEEAEASQLHAADCYKVPSRLDTTRILVHGRMDAQPIECFSEGTFHRGIYKAVVQMGVRYPMRIQMYAWPAILQGQSIILVNPPKSGKTVAYVLPLLSSLSDPDAYRSINTGNISKQGPLALLVCATASSAQFVYDLICDILHKAKNYSLAALLVHGGGAEESNYVPLINGCDILICTPKSFLRIYGLRENPRLINLDRLCHLVFDQADVLTRRFFPEVQTIVGLCYKQKKVRLKLQVPIQVIVASEKWCSSTESFALNLLKDPLVCIGSFLEAALYAQLKPNLYCVSSMEKLQVVLGILESNGGLYKTVVVCNTAADVIQLVPQLQPTCENVLVAHEGLTPEQNQDVRFSWKNSIPGAYPVLVCSDDVLPELKIQDAMCLIHFCLPPQSKTQFGFRFTCLMDNYKSIFERTTDNRPDCAVYIFVEKNAYQLPGMIAFMEHLKATVSPELQNLSKQIGQEKEAMKHTSLCTNVKAFGVCWDEPVCSLRHSVVESLDKPVCLPSIGDLKVKVLAVIDASHLFVRLLEHIDTNGVITTMSDAEYLKIAMTLQKYYSAQKNRQQHGYPSVGDLCVVERSINMFTRGKVMNITKWDDRGDPNVVEVLHIDDGGSQQYRVYQLLVLPDHLKNIPPQAVEVFLCRIMPFDFDTTWGRPANISMEEWLGEVDSVKGRERFVYGKIVLSIADTLWLDPLECRSYLPSVEVPVVEESFRKKLLTNRLAEENPTHLEKLYALCRSAGLSLPERKQAVKVVPKSRPAQKPQWAYMDGDAVVEFHSADGPDQFFVRLHKFWQSFNYLEEEIQKYVTSNKRTNLIPEVNLYCLGMFPETELWCRVKVLEVSTEECLVFFVDYGDRQTLNFGDLMELPDYLMKRLPFQIIECGLASIKPVADDWSEESTNALYDLALEDENPKPIHAKICEVIDVATCTGGHKYKVVLIDKCSGQPTVINKVMVEQNLAQLLEGCNFDIEILSEKEDEEIHESSDVDVSAEATPEVWETDSEVEDYTPNLAPDEDSDSSSVEFDCTYDMDYLAELFKGLIPPEVLQRYHSTPRALTYPVEQSVADTHPAPNTSSSTSCNESTPDTEADDEAESITGSEELQPEALVSTTKTPQLTWYQDEDHIFMKIWLSDVKEYYLCWDASHLSFRTSIDSGKFSLSLNLYGAIQPDKLYFCPKGMYVLIIAEKVLAGFPWDRLQLSRRKPLWIKVDVEHVNDSDDEDLLTNLLTEKGLKSPSQKETQTESKSSVVNLSDAPGLAESEPELDDSSGDEAYDVNFESRDRFDPLQ